MCGIVGLYLKNTDMQSKLGALFAPMLIAMTDRGPDSAGFAIYRNPVGENETKFTLASDDAKTDWESLASELEKKLACAARVDLHGDHAVMVTESDPQAVQNWLAEFRPTIRIVGSGRAIEIFKQTGLPKDVAEQFKLATAHGSHAIGHTRMATESAVSPAHAHPFTAGEDFCLIHNGSLSNPYSIRRKLESRGIEFETDNDTEAGCRFLEWRMREGDTLEQAIETCFSELDGFFTFLMATNDRMVLVRDAFACKPAIAAETDDYVAVASEYRALAHLPNITEAHVFEPEPEQIYSWSV